jgi:hypothetical protein
MVDIPSTAGDCRKLTYVTRLRIFQDGKSLQCQPTPHLQWRVVRTEEADAMEKPGGASDVSMQRVSPVPFVPVSCPC